MAKMSDKMMELLETSMETMDSQTGETLEHTSRLAGFLAYSAVNALRAENDYLDKVRECQTKIEVEMVKKEIIKPRIIIGK